MSQVGIAIVARRRFLRITLVAALVASGAVIIASARPSAAAPPTLFAISPTSFDFGDTPLNAPSPQQLVTITNVSGAPIVMSGVGGGAGPFGGSQDCQGLTIAAGASCHMYYQFTPTAVGAQTRSTSGSWNGQPFAFTFKGNGVNQFLITPTAFDFGDVPVGTTSAQQLVTITNLGSTPVVMSGVGGGGGLFGGSQDCQGLTIAAGASCHMYYAFTPTVAGPQTGSTSGTWNGQPFSFAFSGNGTSTAAPPSKPFLITPTSLDFGDTPLNAPSAQQVVTVTNVSGAPIVMSGAGGAAGAFGGSQDCQGLTIAAGDSCHMYYQFTPTGLGAQTGSASGNWNGQTFSLNFTGNGVSRFLVTPTAFDFGEVPVGTTSAQQVVTITNMGSTPAVMSGAGGAGGAFGGSQDCQGVTIAAGASCHMYYQFSPTAPGLQAGSASGSWNGQAFSLAFTGNGLSDALPVVTSIAPTHGPISGGTSVTITGTGLSGATAVTFGSSPATSFTVMSDTQVIAKSPAQAAGVQDVTVTTPAGTTTVSVADRFTYVAARPSVTHVAPSAGPKGGGTSVTVTGTGFTGTTGVKFGSVAATSLTVTSDTKLTALSPAGSGTQHVTVTGPGGSSSHSSKDLFHYLARPRVTHIAPSSGHHTGGTVVLITGTGFGHASRVMFGGTAAAHFLVLSDTKILVQSPAESRGQRDVKVITPGGTSAAVSADRFTYR
jgi:hypothetical protein